MRDSEKKVERADHNLQGTHTVADDHPIDKADETTENPDVRASWGSEGSGGSARDKRPDR
jgi:hypothetical protein